MLAQSWALPYESGVMIEKESVMVSLERSRSIDNAKVSASVMCQLQAGSWARAEIGGHRTRRRCGAKSSPGTLPHHNLLPTGGDQQKVSTAPFCQLTISDLFYLLQDSSVRLVSRPRT